MTPCGIYKEPIRLRNVSNRNVLHIALEAGESSPKIMSKSWKLTVYTPHRRGRSHLSIQLLTTTCYMLLYATLP